MDPDKAEIYWWQSRLSDWWLWDLGEGELAVTPEGDCWEWDIKRGPKPHFIGRFWWIRLKRRLVYQETIPLGRIDYTPRWRWRDPFIHFLLARILPAAGLFTAAAYFLGK